MVCRLARVSFYGPCSTWRVGHLDQVILLVWPKNQFLLIFFNPGKPSFVLISETFVLNLKCSKFINLSNWLVKNHVISATRGWLLVILL